MPSSDPGASIKQWLSAAEFPPAVAVYSVDRTRRRRAVDYLIAELKKRGPWRVDGADCALLTLESLRMLEASFKTLSLFAESKILVLANALALKKELAPFLGKLLAAATPRNVIILTDAPPEKKNPLSALATPIDAITFPALRDGTLYDWIQREAKRLGLAPLPATIVQDLCVATDHSIDDIASRLERLALFAAEPTVTVETYRTLFPLVVEGNDYKFVESLIGGSRLDAEKLATLGVTDRSAPIGLLALTAKTASQVFQLGSKRAPPPSGAPWLLQKYQKLASRLTPLVRNRMLISLLSADFRLKDRNLGAPHVFSKLSQLFHSPPKSR